MANRYASINRILVVWSLLVPCALTTLTAQVAAPNKAGVSMGQVGTIVKDVDATKKFRLK